MQKSLKMGRNGTLHICAIHCIIGHIWNCRDAQIDTILDTHSQSSIYEQLQ